MILPADLQVDNPLDMETVKEQQLQDNDLQKHMKKYPDRYTTKRIGNIDGIISYTKPGDEKSNWKIALPKSLLQPTIKMYHLVA